MCGRRIIFFDVSNFFACVAWDADVPVSFEMELDVSYFEHLSFAMFGNFT